MAQNFTRAGQTLTIHMAVVSSTAIGNAKKSAGELTYRRSRGRTIASGRVRENNSKTSSQTTQRQTFGALGMIAKVFQDVILKGFDKTKYGSERNNFVKSNQLFMKELRKEEYLLKNFSPATVIAPLMGFLQDSEGSVFAPLYVSNGEPISEFVCKVDSSMKPFGHILIAHDIKAGETAHFVSAFTMTTGNLTVERRKMISVEITPEMIASEPEPNRLFFGGSNDVKFDEAFKVPTGYTLELAACALFFTGGEATTMSSLVYQDLTPEAPGGL